MLPSLRRCLLGCLASGALLMLPYTATAGANEETDASSAFSTAALAAAAPPAGFQESVVWSGLSNPTAIRFADDGRVFVAEQGGLIKVFDNLNDPTATIYADLRSNVHWFWDRGLLGMALDPQFTTGRPYIYVMYTYDAPIGGQPPTWGDACPTPPGANGDGCVVSGRLSRLNGPVETVLINDWCQQYPSHSVGALAFGADGALYASAGDGASFSFADYGQDGNPVNPCGDPGGSNPTPPTAEGGALRSQDIRTAADPATLDGSIIRINPDTGAAMPDNPNAGSADPNVRRIVAHGLRNPFRFTFRPGTNDLYLGDVGWNTWEELDRVPSPAAPIENFGWPCYEGEGRMSNYDALNLNLCENLYTGSGVSPPLLTYHHSAKVAGETCPTGGSSVAGIEFYDGGTFPSKYNGALFFADYSRNCVWVMYPNANGVPDPSTTEVFINGAAGPVDLQVGPGGDLFYVDLSGGTIRRVHSLTSNGQPVADATADPTSGAVPLTVRFDGTGSRDPDGDTLAFAWDLDGDGAYDDATGATPSFTYTSAGSYQARLRVTDPGGLSSTDTVTVTVGAPPTPVISAPSASTTWRVGQSIAFSGSATNAQGAPLPASALSWQLILHHCSALNPTSCHQHPLQTFTGASGSFSAPDHEYPAHLELVLTARDGTLSATTSRRLDPRTVDLAFESAPTGLTLSVGAETQTAPFTRTVIQGSTVGVIAPSPQNAGGKAYEFGSWSDGGAASHSFVAPDAAATYRATYAEAACPPTTGLVGAWAFDEVNGTNATDASGRGNTGAISGATRIATGRFGSALSFDGVNDMVTVADAASLDLTDRATLEAWVNPAAGGDWRTIMLKEQSGQLVYGLYANNDANRPSGHLYTTGDLATSGTSALPIDGWSHVAMTWDGTTQRLYVNGTQVGTRAIGGTLVNSAGALRFGGNAVWGEWFSGRIDEVRIYNRALSVTELGADMTAPVTCSGSPPPTPALAVSRTSIAFTATQGGAGPAAQTAEVTNTGGGTLSFTASETASWLSVSPGSGTAPATLTATPSIAGLAPGTYSTTITVAATGATGSPKTIDVTLTVNPATPVLAVSGTSMTFNATVGGANPAAQTASITNTGGGTLSFTASESASWLSVSPASGSAPATLTVTPSIAGLSAGTYTTAVTVTAAGATGSPKTIDVTLNVNPASPVLTVAPASLSFTATAGAANPAAQTVNVTNGGGGSLSYTASDDQPWLAVSPASGSAPTAASASVNIAGLAAGSYTGTITIASAGTTGSPKTVSVTLTVNPAPPAGGAPVGAWGFNEVSGPTASDSSGRGNSGTISGATRTTSGRFGSALTFDGVNDLVTVADSSSLDLSSRATLEAWVYPSAVGGGNWRTILLKEQPGQLVYGLYANNDLNRPSAHLFTTGDLWTNGTSALAINTWAHVAMTWDGTTQRLFVNGTQVGTRAIGGTLPNSTGALRFGGNNVWGEWFAGRLDEIRIYDRALTAAEISADMTAPVGGGT